MEISIKRNVNGADIGTKRVWAPMEATFGDVIAMVYSTPIQDPRTNLWYTPEAVSAMNYRENKWLIWKRKTGYNNLTIGYEADTLGAPAIQRYTSIVHQVPDQQKYGNIALYVTYVATQPPPPPQQQQRPAAVVVYDNATETEDPRGVDSCHVCGKISKDVMQCSGCKMVKYCDADCQNRDWKHGGHKKICKMP